MKTYYLHNETLLGVKSLYERAADAAEASTGVLVGAGLDVSIQTFYTDVGEPYTNTTLAGLWAFRLNAFMLGLANAMKLYAIVSKRDTAGAETVLFTSSLSGVVTSKKTYSFTGTGAGVIGVDDRLKVEIRADNTGSGNDGTLTLYYERTTINPPNVTCHSQLDGADLGGSGHYTRGPHRGRQARRH
jgi:hypothetical protein